MIDVDRLILSAQEHIVLQGERVLNSPMGQMLRPMLMQMEGQLGNMTAAAAAAGTASAASAAGPSSATQTASNSTPAAASASGSSPVIVTASASGASLSEASTPAVEGPATLTSTTAVTTSVVMTEAMCDGGVAAVQAGGLELEKPFAKISLEEESAVAPTQPPL